MAEKEGERGGGRSLSLTRDHSEVHPFRQISQDSSEIIISNQISEVMWADRLINTIRLLPVVTGNLKGVRSDTLELRGYN